MQRTIDIFSKDEHAFRSQISNLITEATIALAYCGNLDYHHGQLDWGAFTIRLREIVLENVKRNEYQTLLTQMQVLRQLIEMNLRKRKD